MKIRYVWWDWMCVPQRVPQGTASELREKLLTAKGEEVGKQMAIYKGAKKSIVWLHLTNWGKNSPIEKLLKNQLPKKELPEYLNAVNALLSELQQAEPWLTSGWTLQEGVLLSETVLLDHGGTTLCDDHFMHNHGQASVLDLTAGLTTFAISIATAFLKLSTMQDGSNQDEIVKFIRASDKNYQFVAQFLSRLLHSGLIAYTKNSPLYILAGKFSRNYGVDKDQCWALLLGALELGNVTPWYTDTPGMDRVKSVFFESLLKKHQWSILLVAGASADNQKLARLP
ncbi:Heterokaryon incompatibility [Penicillium cf. griseofulvum]|uniref:Heterokaryon incompatibility n=1 Tax=Penicillium cf. griseofulvum TaxID=2972120 RepID=A0A9W9JCD4_9EURO|nr:Heterokaryon incompatibility [Penicillium cf. griseofulvum]KAJ5445585.1 Heterokaryon incompatibility [Penicillium cf. griseofulvum]